jgi:endonuclease YncB( thermonuclease family)
MFISIRMKRSFIMFSKDVRGVIIALFVLLETHVMQVSAQEVNSVATVTTVIDGDTFYTSNDRVRLADINAPKNGTEPGYSIAKYALSSLVGGKTVYLDTDQKTGRDPYGRLIAVVYVKVNSTHYLNVNKALLVQGVAIETDYTNNEFTPSTWTLYVKYAEPTSQSNVGPMGPQGPQGIQGPQGVQGIQGPPGEPAPSNLLYLSLGISALSLILAIVAMATSRHRQ